jgi:hypothetical protein
MGKPEPVERQIEISGVEPREVYFQAETLFKKADRLSYEHTRETAEAPPLTDLNITPNQVLVMVDAALERVRHVKDGLGIVEASAQPLFDPSKTPTDVFNATLEANRQLNLLLDQPFTPSEVYEQLTLAIGYATRLRAQFPGDRIPEAPPLERRKVPKDVLRKLFSCFDLIQQIAETSQLHMLEFEVPTEFQTRIEPSDVYNMATLLVSELRHIWLQLGERVPPRPVYYPGRRFPSHAYQRAGLLERMLFELNDLIATDPGWLARE